MSDDVAAELRRFAEQWYATDAFVEGLVRRALAEIDWLRTELAARPGVETEYGLRLRDGTVLTFDSRAEREQRRGVFEDAQWEVTPLVRQYLPKYHTEWTEETDR